MKKHSIFNTQCMFNDDPDWQPATRNFLTRFSLFLKRKFIGAHF
jgi:hypothetical protein